jgi:cytochrome b
MTTLDTKLKNEIKVWDLFVRGFHWSLVAAFFTAFFSGDDLPRLHIYAGYLAAILVILRVIWGFIGSRYARFTSFVYQPKKVVRYAGDLLRLRGHRYIGHSPAGGAMVLVLLAMILLIAITGLLTLATLEGEGPLAGYVAVSRSAGHTWKALHEFLANVAVGLVVVHICAVLLASLVHGENLVRAMWNGKKRSHSGREGSIR